MQGSTVKAAGGHSGRLWPRVAALALCLATVPVTLAIPGTAFAGGGSGRGGHACRKGRWCSLRSERYPFEVWTKGTSNKSADIKALTKTVGLLDSIWGPETKLMGDPLPDVSKKRGGKDNADDTGNDSSRIDVYIVDPGQDVSRGGDQEHINKDEALAEAVGTPSSAKSRPPESDSAYLLLRRDRLGAKGFRSDVVHEFFHALQFAYNARAQSDCPKPGKDKSPSFWFDEASATWAESYFDPGDAKDEVYDRFADFQSGTDWGLGEVKSQHAYDSFIWPYFMQQQAGPKIIAQTYKRTESAKNCKQLMKAVDETFPFEKNFHDFALRNLNNAQKYETGSLSPITPRYQDLHSDFPDGGTDFNDTPSVQDFKTLDPQPSDQPPVTEDLNIPPLRAWYYELDLDPGIGQVVIDPSQLSQQGQVNVDAVVRHDDGTWTVQQLGSSKGTICNDAQDVTEIDLVVSNHGWDPAKNVSGGLQIQPMVPGCNCPDFTKVSSFNGNANLSFSGSESGPDGSGTETVSLDHSATGLSLFAPANPSDVQNAAFDGPISVGNVHVSDEDSDTNPPPTDTTAKADGSPDPTNSQVSITMDPASCTYTISVAASTATTYTGPGPPPDDGGMTDTATSPRTPIPQGLNLSGSRTIPAYTTGPSDVPGIDAGYYEFGPFSGWGIEFAQVQGKGPGEPLGPGPASFSWNLTPTFRSSQRG